MYIYFAKNENIRKSHLRKTQKSEFFDRGALLVEKGDTLHFAAL